MLKDANNTAEKPVEEIDPLAPPTKKESIKDRWKGARILDTIIIASILVIVISHAGNFLSGIPLLHFMNNETFKTSYPEAWTILMYVSSFGTWLLIILFMVIPKRNRPILKTLKFGWGGNNVKYILISLLIGFVANAAVVLIAALNGSIHLGFYSFDLLPLITCFIAVIIQSGGEEIAYRGYHYRKLARNYRSPLVPIITSSVVFAGVHLTNTGIGILPLISLALMGVVAALIIHYWNSFWGAVAFHTAWNFTQNIIFGLPNSGHLTPLHIFQLQDSATSSLAYDPIFGIEGAVLAIVSLALVIVGIIFFGERKRRSQMTSV